MDALGLDISSRLLREGKTGEAGLPLLRARGEHLPFDCGALDGILCECVLSLLPEPGRALREFHRVLHQGGSLILSDIYLRGGGGGERVPLEGEVLRQEQADDCLKGARSASFMETMLSEAGFAIHLWEDHTQSLRAFAAQLVLAHGSMDMYSEGTNEIWCSGMSLPTRAVLRAGYYLLVARKK